MTNGREENRELFEDNQSNISEEVTHHQEGNESSYNKDDDSLSLTSEEQPSKVSRTHRSVALTSFARVCIFTRGSSHPFLRCTIFNNECAEKDQGRGFSGGQ